MAEWKCVLMFLLQSTLKRYETLKQSTQLSSLSTKPVEMQIRFPSWTNSEPASNSLRWLKIESVHKTCLVPT